MTRGSKVNVTVAFAGQRHRPAKAFDSQRFAAMLGAQFTVFGRDAAMGLRSIVAVAIAVGVAAGAASAQVPADVAAKLRAIGPKIEVKETGAIFAAMLPKDFANGVKIERDLAYGAHEKQKVDVYTPAAGGGGKKPVMIFVHGGAFVGGDKGGAGSPFYDNVLIWAVKNGMVGVNLNYRLAPAAPYPAGIEDLGSAIKWVEANAARYGGDPKKIFIWGHSAGASHVGDYVGHPELWGRANSGLAGAAMTSAVYDLSGTESSPYYGNDKSKYAERQSMPGLLKTKVPLFVSYAELDPEMFHVQAKNLNDALCKQGKCPRFMLVKDQSHIGETYAIGTSDRQLSDQVLQFVRTGK
jgi:triacylglycerol lipase